MYGLSKYITIITITVIVTTNPTHYLLNGFNGLKSPTFPAFAVRIGRHLAFHLGETTKFGVPHETVTPDVTTQTMLPICASVEDDLRHRVSICVKILFSSPFARPLVNSKVADPQSLTLLNTMS